MEEPKPIQAGVNVTLAIETAIKLIMVDNQPLRNVQVFVVNCKEDNATPEFAMEMFIEHQMPGCAPVGRTERYLKEDKSGWPTEQEAFNAFTEFLIGTGFAQYIKEKVNGYIDNPLRKI